MLITPSYRVPNSACFYQCLFVALLEMASAVLSLRPHRESKAIAAPAMARTFFFHALLPSPRDPEPNLVFGDRSCDLLAITLSLS